MENTFTAEIEKFDGTKKLYLIHVKVPRLVYAQFSQAGIKRIISTFNGSTPVHNSFLPDGDGGYYIKLNNDILKEVNLSLGQKIEVKVKEDDSKYGMPIAEEMEELLHLDIEGEVLFHKLTPGKIRSLLFKINGVKDSQKRIEKSVIVLDHLKANKGLLDWKMLNEAWKMGTKI